MRRSRTLLAAGAMFAMLLVVGAQAQNAQDQFGNQSSQRSIEAASDLIGAKVENPQGENLGSVNDLVVDPQSGQLAYVVLSRGGVLGIGAKLYPIPWQATHYNRQDKRVVVDLAQNQLDSAPSFNGDNWPDLASSTWRQRTHSFYQTRGMGGSEGLPAGQQLFDPGRVQTLSGRITDISTSSTVSGHRQLTVQTDDGRSVLVDLAPESYLRSRDINFDVGDKVSVRGSLVEHGGKDMLIATQVRTDAGQLELRNSQGRPLWQTRGMGGSQGQGQLQSGNDSTEGSLIRASKLMDRPLRNPQDQRIGSIKDLAIDMSSGKVKYAVIGAGGGFLGMDEELHAVPWDAAKYDSSREALVLDASKQKIKDAPGFKRGEWSNLSDPSWQSRLDRYYSTQERTSGEPMNQGQFQDGGQRQVQD